LSDIGLNNLNGNLADDIDLKSLTGNLTDGIDLNNLTKKDLELISKQVLEDSRKKKLKIELAREKYENEILNFIDGQRNYPKRGRYRSALQKLKNWSDLHNLDFTRLNRKQCDEFMIYLIGKGIPGNLIYDTFRACSLFYTHLREAFGNESGDNFSGFESAPRKRKNPIVIPSEREIGVLIKEFPPEESAAIAACAFTGLKIGSLPVLTKREGEDVYEYRTRDGRLSQVKFEKIIMESIEKADLDPNFPFKNLNVGLAKNMMRYRQQKLLKRGLIENIYSYFDLKHFFSINQYKIDYDIYRISRLLGHASKITTENYFKNL
jgi:site-specific recombinase XerD